MGRPMAANLARAGFEVVAWNRTPSAPRSWRPSRERDGGRQPAEAAAAGVVISMVPDVPEVEAVLLGEDGAAEGLPEGGLAIDMSTIAPTRAARSPSAWASGHRLPRRARHRFAAQGRGRNAHDHGRRPRGGVRAGAAALRGNGQLVLHVGPQGHGSMVKLINNTLAAVNAAALAEGIVLAQAAGLDVDKCSRWWPPAPATRRCSS